MIMAQEYEKKLQNCIATNQITRNTLDYILLRSHKQKLENYCHYSCSKLLNMNKYKHNGRYPFKEILGCTEFCSALFSLLNLVVHYILYQKYLKKCLIYTKLEKLLKMQYYIFCFCWVSSTLFHINDILLTRYLDYFSALLFLIFAFHLSLTRLSYFYKNDATTLLRKVMNVLCCTYFSVVLYMIFVNFNYKMHKHLCGFFLVCTTVVWLYTYILIRKHDHAKYLIYYIVCLYIGIGIEMFDLPPFFYLIDSHAIWHLITAFIAKFYYMYMKEDMLYENCAKKEINQ